MKLALALPMLAASSAAFAQIPSAIPVVAITGTTLDVSATGESVRVPDLAVISAGVVTQSADAQTAMRDNAARIDRVVAALKRAGVPDRDIQTANIGLAPQYRYKEGEAPTIIGYQASNSVAIRFRDIARSGAILDALVREGANQINGPTLTIDKPEAALDEARTAAIGIARARAQLYAKATGLRVKRIISIGENESNYAPPMPMVAMARADFAAAPQSKVLAGEQKLAVTVNVRFELE